MAQPALQQQQQQQNPGFKIADSAVLEHSSPHTAQHRQQSHFHVQQHHQQHHHSRQQHYPSEQQLQENGGTYHQVYQQQQYNPKLQAVPASSNPLRVSRSEPHSQSASPYAARPALGHRHSSSLGAMLSSPYPQTDPYTNPQHANLVYHQQPHHVSYAHLAQHPSAYPTHVYASPALQQHATHPPQPSIPSHQEPSSHQHIQQLSPDPNTAATYDGGGMSSVQGEHPAYTSPQLVDLTATDTPHQYNSPAMISSQGMGHMRPTMSQQSLQSLHSLHASTDSSPSSPVDGRQQAPFNTNLRLVESPHPITSYSMASTSASGLVGEAPAPIAGPSNVTGVVADQQVQQPGADIVNEVPISTSMHGIMNVYSASPASGNTTTNVSVSIGIVPHEPQFIRGFRVVFGQHGTTTRVVGEKRSSAGERVELLATTPPFHLTSRFTTNNATVQLTLQALDENGNVADWAEIGQFNYIDLQQTPVKGQKRSGSPLSSVRESPQTPMPAVFPDQTSGNEPRTATHRRGHSRGSSMGSLVNGFGHMSYHSRNSSMASMASLSVSESDASRSSVQNSPVSTQTLALQPLTPLNPTGQSLPSGQTQYPGAAGPDGETGGLWINTPDGELIERKPIARLRAPSSHPTNTTPSSSLRHPPIEVGAERSPALYRTSQIPGAGGESGNNGNSTSSNGNSNVSAAAATDKDEAAMENDGKVTPQAKPASGGAAHLVTRASLKFETDLNLMALGWSHDEWLVKRRLVQFFRRQDNATIYASFRPVGLQDLLPNSIVISCIFREDVNECFVTSVDTIYLLEALVAVRFTVEEKNRIRRNLEGYKPITVTKSKSESEEFFKLVMGFPNPKPRNIEKDVKVFPWKILGPALRKIIGKYSASYATPEEMAATVGGMTQVPQPIGYVPGHTPPGIKGSNGAMHAPSNSISTAAAASAAVSANAYSAYVTQAPLPVTDLTSSKSASSNAQPGTGPSTPIKQSSGSASTNDLRQSITPIPVQPRQQTTPQQFSQMTAQHRQPLQSGNNALGLGLVYDTQPVPLQAGQVMPDQLTASYPYPS